MQIFIFSSYCYQPVIIIKKRESQNDHNKRFPLYLEAFHGNSDYTKAPQCYVYTNICVSCLYCSCRARTQ
jgi:hypothetical protein